MLSSEFDLINGLPIHPLIDHVVVVFVPLFAVLQILIVFSSSLKQKYGLITVAGLAVALGSALLAKETGESLAARIGLPVEHAEAGERLTAVVAVLFATSAFWYLVTEKIQISNQLINSLANLSGKLSAVVALVALVAVFLAGHSGAKATWENRVSAKPVVSPSASESVATGITLSEIAQHNSEVDCWTAVDGKVYDLTKFVKQHPGGTGNIIQICGVDGTEKFKNQHGGAATPENTLSNYEIGTLAN